MNKFYYTIDIKDNKTNKLRVVLTCCVEDNNLLNRINADIQTYKSMGYNVFAITPHKTKKQAITRMNTLNKQYYQEKRLITQYKYNNTSIYWGL